MGSSSLRIGNRRPAWLAGRRTPHRADAGRPAVTTVPNVEILEVGTWDASTGDTTVTTDDLAAMVAASQDGHIRPPVVKLGHLDPRFNTAVEDSYNGMPATVFDGTPALGRVENLRLSENGMKLIGDLTGVPRWLADAMPTAFPRRSAEWWTDFHTDTGREHDAVLCAVALLGERYPACETLEDIQALFSADGPELTIEAPSPTSASARGTLVMATGRPQPIAARATDDAVWRAFQQEHLGDWWWIRELYVDPLEVIADDDSGSLWRVPYTVSADGEVEFGEPARVRVEYVDAAAPVAASAARTFASRAEARTIPNPPEENMTPEQIRALALSLGLSADSTLDQVNAEAARRADAEAPETDGDEPAAEEGNAPPADGNGEGEQPAAATPPVPVAAAAGTVTVDQVTFDAMRADYEARQVEERDRTVEQAQAEGRFPAARRAHYLTAWENDPAGTRHLLTASPEDGGLAPGTVPIGTLARNSASGDPALSDNQLARVRASMGLKPRKEA